MNKQRVKPPVKPTLGKPVVVVQPIVSPTAPPAPVWQRLELPNYVASFGTNQFANHAGAIVTCGETSTTYGRGLVSIIPPVGNWVEQTSTDGGRTYKATGVTRKQIVAGANPTVTINLTLDGSVGPAKLMRYLLNQESL